MRLGLIADIHANLDALQVVLFALKGEVDRILFCGDAVGYYDQPNEVCALLRESDIIAVRGNHDSYVTGALTPDPERAVAYRVAWTRSELAQQNLEWLRDLPAEASLQAGGAKVTIRHASPWDEETYIYPDSADLIRRIALAEHEVLVLGHTHHPFCTRVGSGRLINPGSVGQPRDYKPGACYAVLDTDADAVRFFRRGYPIDAMQERLRRRSWPQSAIDILSRVK